MVSIVPATENVPTEPDIVAPVNLSDCVAFTSNSPSAV